MSVQKYLYAKKLSIGYNTSQSNSTIKRNVDQVLNEYPSLNNLKLSLSPREFINKLNILYYPNEVVIKSMFINKKLISSENHVSIFELNVRNSRLDLAQIHTFSTAFEIKTDFDSPKRLVQQMNNYIKVFEKVYLICSEKNVHIYKSYIPDECGIYSYRLTKKGTYIFKRVKTACVSKLLSPRDQLDVFSKKDLNLFFNCPLLNQKIDMINLIVNTYSKNDINKKFKNHLKLKFSDRWEFLKENHNDILEIDYQWFYKNMISPKFVY